MTALGWRESELEQNAKRKKGRDMTKAQHDLNVFTRESPYTNGSPNRLADWTLCGQ
jgi:hypothetical protein